MCFKNPEKYSNSIKIQYMVYKAENLWPQQVDASNFNGAFKAHYNNCRNKYPTGNKDHDNFQTQNDLKIIQFHADFWCQTTKSSIS